MRKGEAAVQSSVSREAVTIGFPSSVLVGGIWSGPLMDHGDVAGWGRKEGGT